MIDRFWQILPIVLPLVNGRIVPRRGIRRQRNRPFVAVQRPKSDTQVRSVRYSGRSRPNGAIPGTARERKLLPECVTLVDRDIDRGVPRAAAPVHCDYRMVTDCAVICPRRVDRFVC